MSWKLLPLPASAGIDLPPLLVSTAFQKDSYTIHLTDLTSIWVESLDRAAIVSRSREESTSIDPGSSADQFAIFLAKIKSGLEGSTNTTCLLTVGSEDEGRASISLRVTVDLPGGLAPLEWPMHLKAGKGALMTNHLIFPLLRAQRTLMSEIEGLKETIRDKDNVIQKVVDKLETSCVDLGQVFAQAAGKPGRKGDWHRERVKGMAAFDWETWKQRFIGEPGDVKSLLSSVFDANQPHAENYGGTYFEDIDEDWWSNIQGLTVDLRTGKISTKRTSKKSKAEVTKKSPQRSSPMMSQGERTESIPATDDNGVFQISSQRDMHFEADELHPSPERAFSPAELDVEFITADKEKAKPKKKLGKIGGKRKGVTEAEPGPNAQTESEPETEDPEPTSNPTLAVTTSEPAAAQPKKKLGQIGGKKRKEISSPPPLESVSETIPAQTPAKQRIGIIGHKRQTTDSQDELKENGKIEDEIKAEPSDPRGRSSVKQERSPSPPVRETSIERADRKRQQLRRELEQKAKAPPKKKKKL